MVLKGKSVGKLSKDIESIEDSTEDLRRDLQEEVEIRAGYTLDGFFTGYGILTQYLSIGTKLRVNGTITGKSKLSIAGDVTFASRLSIGQELTLGAGLNLNNNAVFHSNLSVGEKIITKNLQIPTNAISSYVLTSDDEGNAAWGPGLREPVELRSGLSVGRETVLQSTLSVGNHTLLSSSLNVLEDVTFSKNLTVGLTVTAQEVSSTSDSRFKKNVKNIRNSGFY